MWEGRLSCFLLPLMNSLWYNPLPKVKSQVLKAEMGQKYCPLWFTSDMEVFQLLEVKVLWRSTFSVNGLRQGRTIEILKKSHLLLISWETFPLPRSWGSFVILRFRSQSHGRNAFFNLPSYLRLHLFPYPLPFKYFAVFPLTDHQLSFLKVDWIARAPWTIKKPNHRPLWGGWYQIISSGCVGSIF